MKHKHNNPFKDNFDEELKLHQEIKEEQLDEQQTPDEEQNNSKEDEQNKEFAQLQEKYNELNNQYLRLAADFDNYRKRQAQERENLLKYGAENALKKMIEVLDNFERGEKALEKVEDCETCKESFNLVHKQVCETLAKMGLEEIKAIGEEFDPNFHEAVMQTPTSEHPEHTVITELQKGYKMGDKVLRPTLVNVATAE